MEQKRTIERLWRDAVAAGRTTPAYLVQDGDEWRPLSWSEAAERVEGYATPEQWMRAPIATKGSTMRRIGRVGLDRLALASTPVG